MRGETPGAFERGVRILRFLKREREKPLGLKGRGAFCVLGGILKNIKWICD